MVSERFQVVESSANQPTKPDRDYAKAFGYYLIVLILAAATAGVVWLWKMVLAL